MKGICAPLYYTNGYYLTGLPSRPEPTLFQQAYNAGARVHSNSWGSAAAGDYTADSANADTFIWNNRDMVITFSAGNEGIDANSRRRHRQRLDGRTRHGQERASRSARAKTSAAITIPATQRSPTPPAPRRAASTASSPGVRPGLPITRPTRIKDDVSAGNAQQMAAFSSRGPTDDGRIKPDVVAPARGSSPPTPTCTSRAMTPRPTPATTPGSTMATASPTTSTTST
ncbi:MAG: S8 family serine peptidase [Ignavibacteriales bacterium]|nr:S8 family serine peptidase [Ignavibacteriales bacterium]